MPLLRSVWATFSLPLRELTSQVSRRLGNVSPSFQRLRFPSFPEQIRTYQGRDNLRGLSRLDQDLEPGSRYSLNPTLELPWLTETVVLASTLWRCPNESILQ